MVTVKQLHRMEEGEVLQRWSGQLVPTTAAVPEDGTAPGLIVLAKKELTDESIDLSLAVTKECPSVITTIYLYTTQDSKTPRDATQCNTNTTMTTA